jgi:hypothetical protein
MVTDTLQSSGLPDDFANRIGRLIEARGDVVEADPMALPDLMNDQTVSDEGRKRSVIVQLMQRPAAALFAEWRSRRSWRCSRATVLNARRRSAIAALRVTTDQSGTGSIERQRARKLQAFLSQPFFAAEPYTKRPGSYFSRADALRGCREILDGRHDDLPLDAFYFTGSIEEIRSEASGT